MDARPGGAWRFVMHGPDGVDYKNRISYLEVVKPERLVYKHAGEEKDEFVRISVTVNFEEVDEKTPAHHADGFSSRPRNAILWSRSMGPNRARSRPSIGSASMSLMLTSIELTNMANETYAVFDTTEGRFKAKLFEAEVPKTVQNFVDLAEGKKTGKPF